ncbi:endocuticle structural glycoprotein SgAbd-9-like [Musca autumnalis]|uniref:endocuticle structural glycoprotein SgAbd-9-like n=1 Tax=Musca autumnalis TaxID=221902 RepID=UPI003CF3C1F1
MASSKLLLLCAILAIFSASASAGLVDFVFATIMQEGYNFAPIKEGYRFNLDGPDGSKREEVGMIINPGTPEEELVVMGTYSVYDENTDTDTITMYTSDKDGYKARYMLKNRKLSISTLKSGAGG